MNKTLIFAAAICGMALAGGCGGGGSYTNPFLGDYKGFGTTYSGVKVPGVTPTDPSVTQTVAVTVDSNNAFTATLTYASGTSTLYVINLSGTVNPNTAASSQTFTCTESPNDKGGPFDGQTMEVYYHTFGAGATYPAGVTKAEFPHGFTSVSIYKPGEGTNPLDKAFSFNIALTPSSVATTG